MTNPHHIPSLIIQPSTACIFEAPASKNALLPFSWLAPTMSQMGPNMSQLVSLASCSISTDHWELQRWSTHRAETAETADPWWHFSSGWAASLTPPVRLASSATSPSTFGNGEGWEYKQGLGSLGCWPSSSHWIYGKKQPSAIVKRSELTGNH